jgi:predicted dithiol-disulfide oxidoreductase (DUF899 family)
LSKQVKVFLTKEKEHIRDAEVIIRTRRELPHSAGGQNQRELEDLQAGLSPLG